MTVDYRYDIMNVVIIHLSKLGSQSEDKLIGMLDTLLDTTMKLEDKKKKLSDTHGIPMSIEINEGVTDMCNLSSGIEARGIALGETRGEARGEEKEATRNILKLLKKNKNIQEIVDLLDYSMEKVTKVAKDNGFANS